MKARRIVLPSGKTIEVVDLATGYLPSAQREKRRPTPHFDRLADRCDEQGWSLEVTRMGGGLSVQVWRVVPCGKLLGIARVTSTVDAAARAVLRAL